MSASREKKKRQEFAASGGVDPKAVRAAEEKAAARKSTILYTTVAVVFVVVAAALWIYNSGIFQRSQTAVTLDGEKYSVPQTAYYYASVCNNYASMFGQDYLQSMKTQDFDGTQTWNDYFKSEAVENMKFIHAAKTAAKSAGLSLDADDQEIVKANVESMKSSAKSAGYSYGAYLKAVYGPTMTSSVFEQCIKDQLLASKYVNQYVEENFVYSDDEILAYYEENKNAYDLVDCAYAVVSGAPETQTDAEGNTIEATDEEKAAAMEAAKATAEEILAAYKAGGDLEKLAGDYDATYSENTPSYGSACGEWLFDESRKPGDADVIENETGSNYYVAVFNSRERNEALDYSVRHILVTADNLELAEGEEATDGQIEAMAAKILATWDGTEDGFAKLANENSQDGGSNTTGGLYENVNKGEMVAAFEDWCYEPGRQSGDTGIVQSSYGYHIMYFVGYGSTPYWKNACENALRSNDSSEWQTSLTESVAAETNASGMKNVG